MNKQITVEYLRHMGSDLDVVNAARVSFNKESLWGPLRTLSEKDTKLIGYLAKHNHKSPFNHCFFSFRVKAPLFVARQLVKHEYLTWNEVSRRYVDDEPEFFVPGKGEWRESVENVKQGSGGPLQAEVADDVSKYYNYWIEDSVALYKLAMDNGVCAEQARMILPQSMMTEWIWSGSFYAFIKMCRLRLDPHAQKECAEVAKQVYDFLEDYMPVSTEALMQHMKVM